MQQAKLELGLCGGVFRLKGEGAAADFGPDPTYSPFRGWHGEGDPRFTINVQVRTGRPASRRGECVFDSQHFWKVRGGPRYHFETVPRLGQRDNSRLDRALSCSRDFLSGKLTCTPQLAGSMYPLFDGLDRLMLASVLPLHRIGFLVHSCGVLDADMGVVFVGSRGKGKSTLAELWRADPGATVVSDECCGLCHTPGGWRVYGTPWPSVAMCSADGSAPLRGIFFLEHAPVNECVPVSAGKAMSALMRQVVVPWWAPEATHNVLALAAAVCSSVPLAVLRFRIDKAVLGTIRRFVEEHRGRPTA